MCVESSAVDSEQSFFAVTCVKLMFRYVTMFCLRLGRIHVLQARPFCITPEPYLRTSQPRNTSPAAAAAAGGRLGWAHLSSPSSSFDAASAAASLPLGHPYWAQGSSGAADAYDAACSASCGSRGRSGSPAGCFGGGFVSPLSAAAAGTGSVPLSGVAGVLCSVPFNKLVLKGQQQLTASWQQQQQQQQQQWFDEEDGEEGEVELLDLGLAGDDDISLMKGSGPGIAAAAAGGNEAVPERQPAAAAEDAGGSAGTGQAAAAAAVEAGGAVAGLQSQQQQQQQPKQPRHFAFERHLQMLENTWKQPTA
jgi:hypothetical protein